MKKRRVFDIDFDEAEHTQTPQLETKSMFGSPAPSAPHDRRGPMASAIAENAGALSERAAAEAAIRAENDRLAHELVDLKQAGLITRLVDIDSVRAELLTRDRKVVRDSEIDELKASIRDIGLSNPIQVLEAGDGYELVQGYRRLTAFRELYKETSEKRFAEIPVGIIAKTEEDRSLYRRMVDENIVRKGIGFGEMAAIAWAYLRSSDKAFSNVNEAIDDLFASAGRQKRAYIKNFAKLYQRLEPSLIHVDVIPRALGLEVGKKLDENPALVSVLKQRLLDASGQSAADELRMLRAFVAEKNTPKTTPREMAKTTLRLMSPRGQVKCVAAEGSFSMQSKMDFTTVERARLEAAVAAFWEALDPN